MSRRLTSRILSAALVCLTASASISRASFAAQAPDAAVHKQWMDDASDAQEDFRFAVSGKDPKAAAEALVKLEGLMANTETYWTAKKSADGVRLAKEARALAAQGATAAKGGNLTAAGDAFGKMSTTCNACHALKLE